MRRLLLLTCLALACGGGDGGDPDASPAGGGDGSSAADARATADASGLCSVPVDCPCFTNYDCPDSHACVSQDESGENVFCVAGPRGTGEAGEPCEGEKDCKSALCVEDDQGDLLCSDVCEEDRECPDNLPDCLYLGFGLDLSICAPL
jgi:hypothetical protein